MDPARSPETSLGASALPLTERVLDRLGRPRLFWIVLWSLVPLASPLVFRAGSPKNLLVMVRAK